jgi:hypothetical protein
MTDEAARGQDHPGDGPARELRRAVDAATAFLLASGNDVAELRVTEASNRLRGPGGGPHAWRVTFKLRRLIPDTNDVEIGAGGEWFVDVDLSSGSARLAGLGE